MKNQFTKRDIFLSGVGLTMLLFQLPLVDMTLKDNQSFFLGVWDIWTLVYFCVGTFILIPAVVGLLFSFLSARSEETAIKTMAVAASFIFIQQLGFFSKGSWFSSPLVLIPGFFALAFFIWKKRQFALSFFSTLAFLSIFLMGFFVFKTHHLIFKTHEPIKQEASGELKPEGPVFFLTFEKISAGFFEDEKGRFVRADFPHLSEFLDKADYYPNTYANSHQTVYALQTLYTGVWWRRGWPFWEVCEHIKQLFGRGRKTVMLLDLLGYCNPQTDICIRAMGIQQGYRASVVTGWYKTYLRAIIPKSIKTLLGMDDWTFGVWDDMWAKEVSFHSEGENILHSFGKRQFQFLRETLDREKQNPNLYIMHNFISDAPKLKASVFKGSSRKEILEDNEHWRKNLKIFDDELGLLFSHLKELGIYDSSLIVVTSDTGYDAKSADFAGQKTIPYSDRLSRVFFALKKPNQTQGRTIRAPLQQIDVFPTLLEITGIKPTKEDEMVGLPVTGDDSNPGRSKEIKILIGGEHGEFEYAFTPGDSAYRFLKPKD